MLPGHPLYSPRGRYRSPEKQLGSRNDAAIPGAVSYRLTLAALKLEANGTKISTKAQHKSLPPYSDRCSHHPTTYVGSAQGGRGVKSPSSGHELACADLWRRTQVVTRAPAYTSMLLRQKVTITFICCEAPPRPSLGPVFKITRRQPSGSNQIHATHHAISEKMLLHTRSKRINSRGLRTPARHQLQEQSYLWRDATALVGL